MSAKPAGEFEFVSDLTGFRAPNWLVVRLSGRLRRKRDLFRALATGLKLPAYFGDNWDALEECLRDLSWLGAETHVVLLHEHVPLADVGQRQMYAQILHKAQVSGRTPLRAVFPQSGNASLKS
ncbi:MAG TPA: barstar family protein [Lacipirellulaceae bacterium]|jgi:RNAse (barnase) inhibitor barstar